MRQDTLLQDPADAVVQTAIQMEEIGKDFYDALAAVTSDPKMNGLCRKLAAEEAKHREVFRQIRSGLAHQGKTVLLRDDQLAEARRAAKQAVITDRETIARAAFGGSVAALLEMAIQMQRDAIRFYTALAENLPQAAAVKAIIQEEETHVRSLSALRQGSLASA
jgi:rubrerythrin